MSRAGRRLLFAAFAVIALPSGARAQSASAGTPADGARPGMVVLHVGVHRDAGGTRDIAADGAAGQCSSTLGAIRCPAEGPVAFRWGKGDSDGWTLTGDTILHPGTEGTAWVLAAEDARTDARARLSPDRVTSSDVRALFVREGERMPPAASRGMLDDLLALRSHPDPEVRRALVDALFPWTWRSSLGPLPEGSPVPVPSGTILALARDPDPGVRRQTAALVKSLRPCHLSAEAGEALALLATDPLRSVRRAAYAAMSGAPPAEAMDVEEVWTRAMEALPDPGPPGRSAANTLARLAKQTGPTDVIVPREAVERAIAYHPERAWKVWAAWRREVPFHRPWADLLLNDTLGIGPSLLAHWSRTEPAALAEAITAWEPSEPHSERFLLVRRHLADVPDPALRKALGLPTTR